MTTNLSNYFLVAMPSIEDEVFGKSVVYLTHHDMVSGAVGVIVNKPLNKTLKNAFKDINIGEYNPDWESQPLHLGGPLNFDNGFILHRIHNRGEQLFELTNNRRVLSDIASSGDRNKLFMSIGYAAWSGNQVENEIFNNDWLIVKGDIGLVFDVEPESRYVEALKLLGISPTSFLIASTASAVC